MYCSKLGSEANVCVSNFDWRLWQEKQKAVLKNSEQVTTEEVTEDDSDEGPLPTGCALPLSKPERIAEIVETRRENGRIIIFSEEDATYAVIKKKLSDRGIKCGEIRGRSETRDRLIMQFKKGDPSVLFLNSKSNGAGINLQECTDIILYHAMSDRTRTQIIGRANRIGRASDLHVHQLIVQCGQT